LNHRLPVEDGRFEEDRWALKKMRDWTRTRGFVTITGATAFVETGRDIYNEGASGAGQAAEASPSEPPAARSRKAVFFSMLKGIAGEGGFFVGERSVSLRDAIVPGHRRLHLALDRCACSTEDLRWKIYGSTGLPSTAEAFIGRSF
jgi:hypothetical protein